MTAQQWRILAALSLAEAVSATGSVAVIAGLHAWQVSFGNVAGLGWVLSAYLVISAVSAAIFGRLGDMFGRRRVLLLVIALFLAGSAISYAWNSLTGIVVGRAVQGAAGAILSLLLGLVRDRLPQERVAAFVSTILATASLGSAFALLVAGAVTDAFGPGAIFLFQIGLSATAFLGVVAFVPADHTRSSPARLDWQGGVLFTLGVAGLVFAITQAGSSGSSVAMIALLAGAAALLAGWYFYEKRHSDPLIDVSLLTQPTAIVANLVLFALSVGAMQSLQVIAPLLQQASATGIGFGLSASEMSLVKFPALAFGTLGSAVAAWIVVRRGTRFIIASGCLITGLACLLPILASGSLAATVSAVAILTVGVASAYAAVPMTIMAVCPPDKTSEATGLMAVFRAGGQAVGAQVFGVLLASSSVAAADGHLFPARGAYMLSLAVMAALAFVGALGAMLMSAGIGIPSKRTAVLEAEPV